MINKKYNFISWLRVFASLLVVNLHLIGTTYLAIYPLNLKETGKRIFDYLFNISHIAVPIFFIITGFIYIDKNKECTYKSILKNFKKYFLYLLFFGTFFSILLLLFPNKSISLSDIQARLNTLTPITFLDIVKKAVISVFECKNQFSHMWFLYSLLRIYLVLPIIKAFCEKNEKNIYILFMLMVISKYVISFINATFSVNIYNIFSVNYELIYVVLGGILSYNISIFGDKRIKCGSVIIFLLINLFCVFMGINIPIEYDNIVILIFAVLLFLIFTNIDIENKYIDSIGKTTFLIYLIHPLFLQILVRTFKINVLNIFYIFSLVGIYFAIFICCYVFEKLQNKIIYKKQSEYGGFL